jgi:hypothetical protein
LSWYQNNVFLDANTKTQMIIRETQDVSLNDFIVSYNSGDFSQIHLVDETLLQ